MKPSQRSCSALILIGVSLLSGDSAVSAQTTNGTLRLAGGPTMYEGRVEVYYPDQWGTICGSNWNLASASVACRMLNFGSASNATVGLPKYGTSNSTIWLQSVICQGTEMSLALCARSASTTPVCTHSQDVGVVCLQLPLTTTASAMASQQLTLASRTSVPVVANCTPLSDIILKDGPSNAIGRVHVFLNGTWGTVCDGLWGSADAQVVCRQLCFSPTYARALISNGTSAVNGSVPILMDDVTCQGDESALTRCTYSKGNRNNCTHRRDAYVSCVNYAQGPPAVPVPVTACSAIGVAVTFSLLTDTSVTSSDLSLQQLAPSCTVSFNSSASTITMTFGYDSCMSHGQSNSTHVIYSAVIMYNQRGVTSSAIITRSTVYLIPVSCTLVRDTAVNSALQPLYQTAAPVSSIGSYVVSMVLYKDNTLSYPLTNFPVNITLGDYLTVGVNMAADGSGLRLVLPSCYATPTSGSTMTYALLSNKCSADPTLDIYSINETMVAFRFQVFTFTNSTSVYIHCDARICAGSEISPDCDRTCLTLRRKRDDSRVITHRLSVGPLLLLTSSNELSFLTMATSMAARTCNNAVIQFIVLQTTLLWSMVSSS